MPADFWLVGFKDLHEETDAHFIASQEIKQPQSSAVGQRFEEQFFIKCLR